MNNRKLTPGAAVFCAAIIFAALAVCGCSEFKKFLAKSKNAEARAYLKQIHQAQTEYHNQHGEYASTFAGLGLSFPRQSYSYYLANDVLPYPYYQEPLPESIKLRSDKDGFLAAAVADWSVVDQDLTIDLWTIDQNGKLENVIDDSAD